MKTKVPLTNLEQRILQKNAAVKSLLLGTKNISIDSLLLGNTSWRSGQDLGKLYDNVTPNPTG